MDQELDIYVNVEEPSGNRPKRKRMVYTSEQIYANETEIRTLEPNRTGRACSVFLGLLCLLLLAGLITLFLFYTQENSEWDKKMVQLQTSYNNLTEEHDQLQKRFEDVKKESKDFERKLKDTSSFGWRKFGTSYYYVSTEQKTWEKSREECQKKGADLVIIDSDEEQEFLINLNKRVWIGLTDKDEEDDWKWVNGANLTKSYWISSQPDNQEDEDCVEIHYPLKTIHNALSRWNDLPCSYIIYWVCETVDVCQHCKH
ncbi:CD209 antigen-like protein C [Trachinotus anak]|uniref:CD209 antigen-like protein C n=1 Tax=Trachinotus anak TaxID=443729 RepID=UPI0039F1A0DE